MLMCLYRSMRPLILTLTQNTIYALALTLTRSLSLYLRQSAAAMVAFFMGCHGSGRVRVTHPGNGLRWRFTLLFLRLLT